MKISDEQLNQALSLFRESVHELRPETAPAPVRSLAPWPIAIAAFAMLALLATVPLYRHQQERHEAEIANAVTPDDDALLRHVESDVSLSVPPPMQRLELLMASDSTTDSERTR